MGHQVSFYEEWRECFRERDGELLIVALLLMIIFFGTLALNGYPIIDHDSQRYVPALLGSAPFSLSPQRASIIPYLLNIIPYKTCGLFGIVSLSIVVMSGALALLLRELSKVMVSEEWRRAFCLGGVVVLGVFSFLPVVAISILSEPWSVVALSLAWIILMRGACSLWCAFALCVCSATHPSNAVIIGSALLVSFLVSSQRSISTGAGRGRLALLVVASLLIGVMADRALFLATQGDSPRMRSSFVGGAILNFYPRVFEDYCAETPESKLCDHRLPIERKAEA